MKRCWVISIICVLSCIHLRASADDIPFWVYKTPADTTEEKFYVGSSARAASHAEAIEAASKSAIQRAVTENFGVEAQIQNEAYESTTSSSVTTVISEKSRRTQLHGFETRDTFIQRAESGWSAYILYGYKKSEIAAEKKRLASIKQDQDIKFSEIGTGHALIDGQIEITSDPSGATVLIDGKETLSKTPIRLTGVLETGKHSIVIDHPDYEMVTREVIVQPGLKTPLNVKLVPAVGFLSVTTTPTGASVIIDGVVAGTSPIRQFQIQANRKIKIDFIHPDAERSSIETTVARNESRTIEENLRLKPATLQIAVVPRDAKIEIDGRFVEIGWQTLVPGKHTIAMSAPNFQDSSLEIELRGGERRIETVKLTPLTEIERERMAEESRLKYSPWVTGLTLGWFGPTFRDDPASTSARIGVVVQKRFIGRLGIELAFSEEGSSSNISETNANKYDMTGWSYQFAIPIFLSENVYCKPLLGHVSHKYKVTQHSIADGNVSSDYQVEQNYFGGSIGYEFRWNRVFFPIEFGATRYSDSGARQGVTSGIVSFGFLYAF